MVIRSVFAAAACCVGMSALASDSPPVRTLTFEDRVAAQRAIEEVYWRHRIWPAKGIKPAFATVMSEELIQAKVIDYLRESSRPEFRSELSFASLHAEVERMLSMSRAPIVLHELLDALDNDPFLIAETLGRQILLQRLSWARRHSADPRIARTPTIAADVDTRGANRSQPWGGPHTGCADDSWTATSTAANCPAGRHGHTAVWTGAEMIVWGGDWSNTGGIYNPTTDSWMATSVGPGVPSGRSYHSAVWTGTEMVIWGGYTSLIELGTGGRFSPSNNVWAAIPSGGGAPNARYHHTAVWTGTEMIVWGGRDNAENHFNTGGRYYPATNSWIPTSVAAGVPLSRTNHTAIWTGSEMIVWGGYAGLGVFPTAGGRYRPSDDTWAPTSTGNNVPAAGRIDHNAVWTGTEMIVWGGHDISSYFNTGGRYDPEIDSWFAISALGIPSARGSHTAVWTGSQMIVWGGSAPGTPPMNDGAKYSPFTDSWAPTPVAAGVPTGRFGHTAVWTGTEMIVWGGGHNSGGRYCASVWSYRDADGDGYGDAELGITTADGSIPPGYVADPRDCNDANAAIRPGASEDCNGIDDNCDGDVDEGLSPTLYRDLDGDGYGDPNVLQVNCTFPAGWVTQAGDCDDTRGFVHVGAPETCNTIDDDCDGLVDEDSAGIDTDGDSVRNACDNCRSAFNPDQLDTDSDSIGNSCDNCVGTVNPEQQDLDSDQRGDVCDNCTAAYNPLQDDFDADRRGDACDNCLFDFNPSQSDFDHDSQGDYCDLNDGLIYVFSTDDNYVEWQAESGPSNWNVYEGSLSVLKSSGVYTQAPGSNALAQRTCGVADPYLEDFESLAAGVVKFSLVTGVTGGVEGSLGTNSAGATRPNANPCP